MKWLRKHKDEIIGGVQFFVMLYTMTMGFYFSYIFAWFKVGLPVEWWSLLVTLVLALLSTGGLCQWICER